MDIFVIKTELGNNIDKDVLKIFQKKEITNSKTLFLHCFSYYMTDKILDKFYHIDKREIVFYNNKPTLKSSLKHFSVSHSGKYIALAFSDNNCGIDIEEIKNRDFEKISERMNFKSRTLEEFYQNWTAFESDYKLGETVKSRKSFTIENYVLTASSNNTNEEFNIKKNTSV